MANGIIVIPCYNEAARLDVSAFEPFAAQHCDIQFLFIDDGSSDRTLALLQTMHGNTPDQFLAQPLPHNMGKAEAVRQGLREACAKQPQFVGFFDADLATPLNEIPGMLADFENYPHIE